MGREVDSSGEIGGDKFGDIFGLKKHLLANERKIAYNFARKYFEYANGHEPTLAQRLHLWEFLGRAPGNRRLKTLVAEVIQYSLSEANE